MSTLVYEVLDGNDEDNEEGDTHFFVKLADAESAAREFSERPGDTELVRVFRMSVPYATSAVVARMLNGDEWAEARTEVARYRSGKKVDPE
jgi:hypothetical protein